MSKAAQAVTLPPALAWVRSRPFFQAALAGYSDATMRLLARRMGCPFCLSPALLDTLLLNGGRGLRPARLCQADHPVGGQLIGSRPETMARAAELLVDMGFDLVEVNLACPVKKIRRRKRGGHLLAEPDQACDILQAVAQAVGQKVPVTVKLRHRYDDSPGSVRAFEQIWSAVVDLGYAAATVHPRTVVQQYTGRADWSFLCELVERSAGAMARGLLLFGSGDVEGAQSVAAMLERTGVSAVAIARGAVGNPWIFRQARQVLAGRPVTGPTLAEQRAVMEEHFRLAVAWHGPRLAARLMRKFAIRYAASHPRGQEVARAFVAVQGPEDWQAVLDRYYRPEPASRTAGPPGS